jgi:hypothetical protein
LMNTGAGLDVFLTPTLTGSISVAYAYLDASLDMESYRQFRAGIALVWEPVDNWRMEAGARWDQKEYCNLQESMTDIRKKNQTRSVSLQLSRFWGALELFGLMRLEDGESPLYYESYTQGVAQCGLSWSF